MTTPSSLKINLPPRFANSFWSSPDYRKGVEALYARLQGGLDENACILSLVEHRVAAEYSYAEQLASPSPLPSFAPLLFKNALREGASKTDRGFAANESIASHAFLAIEREAIQGQSEAHAKLARTLERNILYPFRKWSEDHLRKVTNSWEFVDANLQRYERQRSEAARLRSHYDNKCLQADEAEDDARFAGGELASPPFLSSDSETVSEKQTASPTTKSGAVPVSVENDVHSDPDRLKRRETIREQFGFRRAAAGRQGDEDKYTPLSPRSASAEVSSLKSSDQDNGLKRSNTISSALSSALSRASEVPALQNLRAVVGGLNEPRHLRLRKEAESAEHQYRDTVRALDRLRCEVEEILVDHFNLTEGWEASRLTAVKRVLSAFNAAFLPLLPAVSSSLQRASGLENTLHPDQLLVHLIVDARTGPYQPQAQVFHPYYHDDPSSLAGAGTAGFGMDLTAFMRVETLASESGQFSGEIRAGAGESHKAGMPAIPLALMALLATLERMYDDKSRWPTLPEGKGEEEEEKETSLVSLVNGEKRKSWIYEVPIANSHMCREAIISHLLGQSVPGANVGAGLDAKLKRFDAPTLAATVKLWAMELVDSLVSHDLWDVVDNSYRAAAGQEHDSRVTPSKTVGEVEQEEAADKKAEDKGKGKDMDSPNAIDPVLEETIKKGILADLKVILARLPKIHLVCLDAIVGHLARLIKSTTTANESDAVYLNKLGLSLGRSLIRPPLETARTIRSRAPTLLAHDLIKYYDDLFPSLLETRAKESEAALMAQRRTPIRKRTKPVDQRMSRSRMAVGGGAPPIPPTKEGDGSQKDVMGYVSASDHVTDPPPAPPTKLDISELGKHQTEASDSTPTPTPIASRLLGGSNANQSDDGSALRVKSPSNASVTSSSYDTPDEADDKTVDASPMLPASSPHTSSTTMTQDDDKSLSNVARLSRQFGSSSSVKSMVRGPRAANAGGKSSRGTPSGNGKEE